MSMKLESRFNFVGFFFFLCLFLTALTVSSFQSRGSLKQVIQNRLGLESFTDKLMQVAQNENYTRAAKKPHLYYKHPSEIVFDYEFTRLFKGLESKYWGCETKQARVIVPVFCFVHLILTWVKQLMRLFSPGNWLGRFLQAVDEADFSNTCMSGIPISTSWDN